MKIKLQTSPTPLMGERIVADAYSILLDGTRLIFNHAIQGIDTSKKIFEEAYATAWGQVDFFNNIITNKREVKIFFLDQTEIITQLIYFMPDKLFTTHSELSLIQKGSIAYIEII